MKDRSHWTVRKVSFEEAEELDIAFWADKDMGERMKEASEWIENVWESYRQLHGEWPTIPDGKQLKSQTGEDDF
jgi:23S rRNA G2069 N7-methylase RlmK/C1962 C5-methylase RlmI